MTFKILLLLGLCSLISAGQTVSRIGKIYKKPNIGLVTFAMQDRTKLTKLDKQRALDIHNALRAYIAKGKETHSWNGQASGGFTSMPQGANMQAMSWDDDLAEYAQNWADKCKSVHSSMSGDPLLKFFENGNLAESLAGGVSALERDMYGEVEWWNYRKFGCQPDKQCGHYLSFVNWGFNHLGCGFKACKKWGVDTFLMVCLYGGYVSTAKEDGKVRQNWQREYMAGTPCSKCSQGWDYCMDGGLCATKKQCESDSGNNCKCLHDEATCSDNGGEFDADACTCKCPADKMGINCAESCRNFNTLECGEKCTANVMEKYQCQKSCGSCGGTTSAAYRYYFVDNHRPNKDNFVVRARMEDPDAEASKRTPKGDKNCKNEAGNPTCEKLKVRGYCKDFMMGSVVKDSCKLSCGAKCEKKSSSSAADDIASMMASMGISGGNSGGGPKAGTSAGSLDLGGLNLGDLSGFSVVRRRRR